MLAQSETIKTANGSPKPPYASLSLAAPPSVLATDSALRMLEKTSRKLSLFGTPYGRVA